MASIAPRSTRLLASSASRNTETPSEGLRDHGVCLFGPRVRFPDDPTDRSYVTVLTMTIRRMHLLAAVSSGQLAFMMRRLPPERRRGRPWSRTFRHRVLIACVALRTNLTIRELAAVFQISKSTAHRIVATITPKLAALVRESLCRDRRWSWIVDGTLIPTRDHSHAAKSKNYRYSCNAQLLVRRRDLAIVASVTGGPGNRNDPAHYRGSEVQVLCKRHGRMLADGGYRGVPELVTPTFRGRRIVRDSAWRRHRRRRARVEHAIARLKVWRVLRDHRRRGCHLADTLGAVSLLHNLSIRFRDNP
jgi:hypothetical protein